MAILVQVGLALVFAATPTSDVAADGSRRIHAAFVANEGQWPDGAMA
jgi:hypothetical protein